MTSYVIRGGEQGKVVGIDMDGAKLCLAQQDAEDKQLANKSRWRTSRRPRSPPVSPRNWSLRRWPWNWLTLRGTRAR